MPNWLKEKTIWPKTLTTFSKGVDMAKGIELKKRTEPERELYTAMKIAALIKVRDRAQAFRNYAVMCLNGGADPQHLTGFLNQLDQALHEEKNVK
jgi:hypothetical protein